MSAITRSRGASPAWVGAPISTYIAFGVIAVVITLAHAKGLTGSFVLDDDLTILGNASIRHLDDWRALLNPTSVFCRGRPLLNLSFALNFAAGGTAVTGYHVTNLAIHVLNAWVLWALVRRTMATTKFPERTGVSAEMLALGVAVAWGCHPLGTAAVTYVSQRAESLMGLFYLLTLYCFARGTVQGRTAWWQFGAVIFCAAGMAVKEVMVTAPLMCLCYDRAFVSGTFDKALRSHWRVYVGMGASWLLLAALMFGNDFLGRVVGSATPDMPGEAYPITQLRAVAHYARLVVWPNPLVFDYGMDLAVFRQFPLVWSAGLVCGLLIAAGWAWLRRPPVGMAGVWFFLLLAPTSTFVRIAGQPIAENRAYLPAIAIVTLMVVGAAAMLGRRGVIAIAAIALALGVQTSRRSGDYRSRLALWQDTVAKLPGNHRAQSWLGHALLDLPGRYAEAIQHLQRARELGPWDMDTHQNLGTGYLRDPKYFPEAIGCFETVVKRRPDDPMVLTLMGIALAMNGVRLDEARGYLEKAVRLRPDRGDFQKALGAVLLKLPGREGDAAAHLETAVRLTPDDMEAHLYAGNAYLDRPGGLDRALVHYTNAVRLNPNAPIGWFHLGSALMRAGRFAEAERCLQNTLALSPGFAPAINKLAELRAATATPQSR